MLISLFRTAYWFAQPDTTVEPATTEFYPLHRGHDRDFLSLCRHEGSNGHSLLGSLIYNANSLLSYFFVLTGFVLISSFARNGAAPTRLPIKPFWIKRVTRLYPLHWLALLLTIGLTEAQVAHDPATFINSLALVKLLAYALLLQAWYPSYSFALVCNYVSWTLCVDLLMLLIAPLLYNWMVKRTTPILLSSVPLADSLVVTRELTAE